MKVLRNTTVNALNVSDTGVTLDPMSDYTIPPQDYLLWAASSSIVTFVGNSDVIVNDGSFDLTISDGVDLLKGLFPTELVQHAFNTSLNMPTANSEYSYDVPNYARRIEIRTRDARPFQLAFNTGESSTNYRSVSSGEDYIINGLATDHNLTFYLQSRYADQTLEITYYR